MKYRSLSGCRLALALGSFCVAASLAQATQGVYVPVSNQVMQYDLNGNLQNASFLSTAANNPTYLTFNLSNRDFYVSNNGDAAIGNGSIYLYGSDGTAMGTPFISGLSSPRGIAFDSGGNIYIANYLTNVISEYGPTGTLINADFITVAGSSGIVGLVIDGNDIYVADPITNVVAKYNLSGSLISASFIAGLTAPYGLALSSTGELLVGVLGGVGEYSPVDGSAINASLISGASGYIYGVGVDYGTGNIYIDASQSNDSVGEYQANGTPINANLITGLNYPSGLAVVPEPGDAGMLAGLAALGLLAWRRKRKI